MKKFNNIFYKNIRSGIESIEDPETKKLLGIELFFNPIHEDKIYHKSTGEVVPVLPKDLSIKMDMKNLLSFTSLLLETISSYLYNIRSKILKTDLIEIIDSKMDDKYKVRVRVSRHFFREEEKGRYKISMAFIDKEKNEEVVNINLTKRDILILIGLIKKITISFERETGVFVPAEIYDEEKDEILEQKNVILAKIDNSILIDDVWLHGQEIMNTLFTVQDLTYKLHIEKNLKSLQSRYRQITFVEKDEILYLEISKMNKEHEKDNINEEGLSTKVRLPFTSKLLAGLFMFLDITILRHADFEDDIIDNSEIIGKKEIFEGEKIKYHLGMKESVISIGVKNRRNNKNETRVMFYGKTKDDVFSEVDDYGTELPNHIKKYDENGDVQYVRVLTDFKINLKDQWIKLVRGLSMAYTQEYIEERERNMIKFFVINQDGEGRFKYDFKVLGDPNNKATSVLIIDKYKLKNREEHFEGRYRQPLFKKYTFQLITMILAASRDVSKIRLSEEKDSMDLLKYSYKSFKKVKEVKKSKIADYGIEKDGEDVWLGNFAIEGLAVKLPQQDIELLNISSLFRIYNGYWLPFTGEKVSIGQDGYLTDMFSEVNLEEKYGVDWATRLYFGTSE